MGVGEAKVSGLSLGIGGVYHVGKIPTHPRLPPVCGGLTGLGGGVVDLSRGLCLNAGQGEIEHFHKAVCLGRQTLIEIIRHRLGVDASQREIIHEARIIR